MSYSQTSNITVAATTLSNSGTLPTSSGTYTITAIGGGGGGSNWIGVGGGGGGGNWTSVSTSNLARDTDVVIKRPNGREIRVGALLEQLMDMLMVIPVDTELHDKYPALKAAYEHHQSIFNEILASNELKDSYDSYRTLRNLVGQEEDA